MMKIISEVQDLSDDLRAGVLLEIKKKNISDQELAEVLGLLPVGVDILKTRRWTLAETVNVIMLLQLNMNIELEGARFSFPGGR